MNIDNDGVQQIVDEIWTSMLGLDVAPGPGASGGGGREVCAAVQITGGWQGAFIIECPERSAAAFAAAMLGYDEGEVPPESEVHDVVGELANMGGGNLKAIVGEESKLSLPTVASGAGLDLSVLGATEVVRLDLVAGDAPFAVVVVARSL